MTDSYKHLECKQCDRIERPVPTTDELSVPTRDESKMGVSTDRLRDMAELLDGILNRVTLRQVADELDRLRASVPTREQIAEVLWVHDLIVPWAEADLEERSTYLAHADAVLALLNGADR